MSERKTGNRNPARKPAVTKETKVVVDQGVKQEVITCNNCVSNEVHEKVVSENIFLKQSNEALLRNNSLLKTDLSVSRTTSEDRAKRIAYLESQLKKLSGFSKWWYGISY